MEIRGQTISYSSYKKKQNDKKEKQLAEGILKLEQNLTEDKTQALENLKSELTALRQEKVKGAVIRSRATNLLEGEKPTKYFCSLETHNYLSKIVPKLETSVLSSFNFGPSIIQWISTFYKNTQVAVNQGCNLSSFFNTERGCKQGDPISPYIFILCAEILALKIKLNEKIKGIKINNNDFILTQYADDTTVILDGSEESLNETLHELENYANISGLKVNFSKTHVVLTG